MANPFARAARQGSAGWGRRGSSGYGGAYGGAAQHRLVADFFAPILSADAALAPALPILRGRSRQLVRNNAHARRFVGLCAKNVIGPQPMYLMPKVAGRSGTLDKATNKVIQQAYDDFSKRRNFSLDRRLSRAAFTRLVWMSLPQDGEVFIRKIEGARNGHGFALQLIDPDLVDVMLNRAPGGTGPEANEIRMGVELDRDGAAVAYYVWNRHPSDRGSHVRQRIDASEIEHVFVPLRPGQTRGVPWFAPVMLALNMLDGYREAELVAARMGASKMAAIINKNPDAIAAWNAKDVVSAESGEDDSPRTMDFSPGMIPELLPGQEMQWYDPTHPTSAFGPFEAAILRTIAIGTGTAYTSLSGDMTGTSYSSGRMGLIDERDDWRTLQAFHVEHVEEPVYEAWMPNALLTGALPLASPVATPQLLAAVFQPRGWQWVDLANEAEAAERQIKLGLNSRTRIAAEQGRDWEEVLEELRHEEDLADEYGVDVSGSDGPTAGFVNSDGGPPQRDRTAPDGSSDSTDDDTSARGNPLRRVAMRLRRPA
jgi:lambda family phage portal protein